jgi:iron complex outermembrane receptor protein
MKQVRSQSLAAAGLSVLLSFVSTAPLPAQTATPIADEVITLPDFTVAAPRGYSAAETSTGTRIATSLRELPFSVGVVTSEFLNDFAAYDLREQFAYVSGVSVREGQGNYNLRGMQAIAQLRNGFFRAGLIDKVNIDRAEVIKGPAASIYGRTAPGGVINIVTKKPPTTPFAQLQFQGGGYDLSRVQAALGGPLARDRVFFRVDGAIQHEANIIPYQENDQQVLSTALTWKLSPATSLTLEFERVERSENGGEPRIPFVSVGGVIQAETATELREFNIVTPDAYVDRDISTSNITLEHRLNDRFSLRAAAFVVGRSLNLHTLDGETYDRTARTITGRSALFRDQPERADGAQVDLLTRFDLGPTSHKLLTTLDYFYTTRSDTINRLPNALLTNPAFNIRTLSIDAPNYFLLQDRSAYTSVARDQGATAIIKGVFVSDRVTFAGGRGILMAGARYDRVRTKLYDRLINTTTNPFGARSNTEVGATTWQLGANWKLSEPFTLFANQSTSFNNQTTLRADGTTFDPEEGRGWETGVKGSVWQNRLTFTTSYFDMDRSNIVRRDPTLNINVLSGRENSHGVEFDFTARVNESWQLFGQAAKIKARVVSAPDDPTLVGLPLPQAPEDQYSLGTRYDFRTGRLKGLYFTAGYRYFGQVVANTSPGNRRLYRQPAYELFDIGLGYGWRAGFDDKLRHTLSLNVKNLLDEEWYYGDRKVGNGRQLIAGYTLTFK